MTTRTSSCFETGPWSRGAPPSGRKAGIAREHLGGVAVEPHEAERRAGEGGAGDGGFARAARIRDADVGGEVRAAGDVEDDGVGEAGGDEAAAGEAVEPSVRLSGVGGRGHDEHGEGLDRNAEFDAGSDRRDGEGRRVAGFSEEGRPSPRPAAHWKASLGLPAMPYFFGWWSLIQSSAYPTAQSTATVPAWRARRGCETAQGRGRGERGGDHEQTAHGGLIFLVEWISVRRFGPSW